MGHPGISLLAQGHHRFDGQAARGSQLRPIYPCASAVDLIDDRGILPIQTEGDEDMSTGCFVGIFIDGCPDDEATIDALDRLNSGRSTVMNRQARRSSAGHATLR